MTPFTVADGLEVCRYPDRSHETTEGPSWKPCKVALGGRPYGTRRIQPQRRLISERTSASSSSGVTGSSISALHPASCAGARGSACAGVRHRGRGHQRLRQRTEEIACCVVAIQFPEHQPTEAVKADVLALETQGLLVVVRPEHAGLRVEEPRALACGSQRRAKPPMGRPFAPIGRSRK